MIEKTVTTRPAWVRGSGSPKPIVGMVIATIQ